MMIILSYISSIHVLYRSVLSLLYIIIYESIIYISVKNYFWIYIRPYAHD